MMTSLFSSFDPMSGLSILNYSPLILSFSLFYMVLFFLMKSRTTTFNTQILYNTMKAELEASVNKTNKKGKMTIILGLFFFILIMNLMGLLPYVFTLTAHLSVTLCLALPFWLSFMLFSMINTPNLFLSHLVPISTPLPLSQFMVLIETTSLMIRPITLSVRLAANMTAGHILMALGSSTITILNTSSLALLFLIVLEFAVAIIQSYVFTVLTTMYLSEV